MSGPAARPPPMPADHALRAALHGEIHARPLEPVEAPTRVTHLALLTDAEGAEAERAHLVGLCERENVPPPVGASNHFRADFGRYRLKWERHTEFTTYAFYRRDLQDGAYERPFEDTALSLLPESWRAEMPGEILAASHLALEPTAAPEATVERLGALFSLGDVMASRVASGAAQVWTDLRVHEDGFSRFLVRDCGLGPRPAGRLVQRLQEIETYRMMALLALPLAREAAPTINRIDRGLADITRRVSEDAGPEDEQGLLNSLSALAAEIETLTAKSAYRFSASRAYYALVRQRLDELGEERLDEYQSLSQFMERRLAPAMNTCESVATLEEALSRRVERASNLLRTRVDIALEHQNRGLLESMNRRARLQLRLQHTVEGLSVVAISYYLVGLLGYAFEALEAARLPINVTLAKGLAIVPVAVAVWLGVRRVRRSLLGAAKGEHS